jgi:hypothetical protein
MTVDPRFLTGMSNRGGKRQMLAHAPEHVLARLARATTCLAWGMSLISGGFLLVWVASCLHFMGLVEIVPALVWVLLGVLVVPGSMLWCAGVLGLHGHAAIGTTRSPANLLAERPAWFGKVMMGSQVLWPIGCLTVLVSSIVGGHGTTAGLVLAVAGAVIIIGASCGGSLVCLVLKDLGLAGNDDFASNRFHGLTVGLPVLVTMLAILRFVPLLLGISIAVLSIMFLLITVSLGIPATMFNAGLWSVASTCRWARQHAEELAEKDERFAARARAAAQQASAAARGNSTFARRDGR